MSRLHLFALCVVSFVTACSDSEPGAPALITVSTSGTPKAIAFRDGLDGAWQVPTATTIGSYQFEVHGPYTLSIVCDAVDLMTWQMAQTPDDNRALNMECYQLPVATSTVSGRMAQPGSITVGNVTSFSDFTNWDFQLDTQAGTFDLIGVSNDRIMRRRDISITGTVDLGTIDVDQQGFRSFQSSSLSQTRPLPKQSPLKS